MLMISLVFLFIMYCILEGFKYNKPEYTESESRLKKKKYLKANKTLIKKIVYLKSFVFLLFFTLLIAHHFIDPLSRSTGIKGLLTLLSVTMIIWCVCIKDITRIRRPKNNEI